MEMREKLKKLIFVMLAAAVCTGAAGCGEKADEAETDNNNSVTAGVTETTTAETEDTTTMIECDESPSNDISLNEMIKDIYNGVEVPMTFETEINDDNALYYLGLSDTSVYSEAISSEAMVNVIPHSVCLVKVADGQDVEEIKSIIEEHANPNKWICAFADTVIVDNVGDVIILIMANEPTANAVHNNFMGLA